VSPPPRHLWFLLLVGCAPVQFARPFQGEARATNFFDHDVPREFVDTNGHMLTYWGEDCEFIDGHEGYDFDLAEGTPVLAVADAKVDFAGLGDPYSCPLLHRETRDLYVRLEMHHRGEILRLNYQHLSRLAVSQGQSVKKGDVVGYSGNSGCSLGPHLHLVVWRENDDGKMVPIDPYGFQAGRDPWEANGGAPSELLWAPGEAPVLFRETRDKPNPRGSGSWVTITRLRWQGVDDEHHPNNELVEVTLDAAVAPERVEMAGFTITDRQGDVFHFPPGFVLTHEHPTVRVYTGSGTNTADTLYWGLPKGIWRNRPASDCAVLNFPNGKRYTFTYGKQPDCPPETQTH
jgi:murein DD-endopeptidase MepM/ murein hydrolase activator NlpD